MPAPRLQPEHFARWLELCAGTGDGYYAGEKAELAKVQATRIAWSISRRLLGESGSELITLHRQPYLPSNIDSYCSAAGTTDA